jgi:hypothetical protein
MSSISTTPVPTVGRKPVAIGLAVLGVITVGAVAIPRIHLGGTTTTTAVSQPQPADFLDRHDAMVAAAAAQASLQAQRLLDSQARVVGHSTVVQPALAMYPAHVSELGSLATAYGAAATSVGREQVGQYHRTYTWTPAMAQHNPLGSTDAHEQVGGLHRTYAYQGRGLQSVTPTQLYDGRALRLTWSDAWVPPVDNPDWKPFIRAHYFGGTVAERIVRRGD